MGEQGASPWRGAQKLKHTGALGMGSKKVTK